MKWLILSTLLLCGCTSSLPVHKEFDKSGEVLELTIYTYQNGRKLNKNVPKPAKGLNGQAIYAKDDNLCEVHVIGAKYIDDDATTTLGHELLHCLYGDYHKHY